jgi:hypothetical protein
VNATHSIPGVRGALTALVLSILVPQTHAQLRRQSYETPAIIETEFSSLRAPEGTNVARINLFRTGEFREYTRIDYATIEGTAEEGADYKGTGGTLVFQPGEGMKTIELQILGDRKRETDEQFAIKFTALSADTILVRETVTITIQDVSPRAVPKLVIAPAPQGAVKLSWESDTDLLLQRNADPAGSTWETVTTEIVSTDDRREVTENNGGKNFFYRLSVP